MVLMRHRHHDGDIGGSGIGGEAFALPELDWSSWSLQVDQEWARLTDGGSIPDQGWKIHCSSEGPAAQAVLESVSRFCHERSATFKYVPTAGRLAWRNSKQAPAEAAAKFITLYPRPEQLEEWLVELHEQIGDVAAPSILGDLRWRGGPLHVRYGGFRLRKVLGSDGRLVPAISGPEGRLVPDVRGAAFHPPAWVELPPFLAVQRDESRAADPEDLADYDFESAIAMTAAGGTYRAVRRVDGVRVIIKEARPFIGVASGEATARLSHESRVLDQLIDVEGVVTKAASFTAGGHAFLVLRAVGGDTLNRVLYSQNPLISADSGVAERVAYRDRVLALMRRVSRTVDRLHAQGVVHGDLHPGNVIVGDGDRPVIIDFEAASDSRDSISEAAVIGVHGYAAPATIRGAKRDEYALAAMTLNAFVPLSFLHDLDPGLLGVHLAAARRAFRLDEGLCASLHAALDVWHTRSIENTGDLGPATADSNRAGRPHEIDDLKRRVRACLSACIDRSTASAEAVRPVGAVWVMPADGAPWLDEISALQATGGLSRDERLLLMSSAGRLMRSAGRPSLTLGLLGGLASHIELLAGQKSPGVDALASRLRDQLVETDDLGLRDGLAGIGLSLLAQEVRSSSPSTVEAVDEISRRLSSEVVSVDRWLPGLLDGLAGIAVFHIAYARERGCTASLALARALLIQALARCVFTPDGRLEVRDGSRTLPTLADGSAGLGLAILLYLAEVDDPELERALPGIERACSAELVIHAGLFDGRAGMMLFLVELARSQRGSVETAQIVLRHAKHLRWSAVRTPEGITFPARDLEKTATGLAHGAAGVLIGLDAASRLRRGGDALASLPDYLSLRAGGR
jgi:serine/threonine protein kinase